jgi:hypothetical protein
MAKLRWRPPSEFLDLLVSEAVERRDQLGGQELTLLLHG